MGDEERLRSLITKLQAESSVLGRVVYKNKNQHRRSRYFQYLLKVRRDLKLLEAAKISQILNALFPVIDGKRAAERALRPIGGKKQSTGAKYSNHERLLGVARLHSNLYITLLAPPYLPSSGENASHNALNKLAERTIWPPQAFGSTVML